MTLAVLALASFFAGLIDAVAGGGGLVTIPTLFSLYPATAPATLVGTNKAGVIFGTGAAAYRYVRQVRVYWSSTLPTMVSAFLFAIAGAHLLKQFPAEPLRRALPFVLLALLLYMVANKSLGLTHAPRASGHGERLLGIAGGAIIGMYDGFFGPGAGSFLILLFVRGFGYDFLHANASGKLVNLATNAAAILLLALAGHVWWRLSVLIAVANIAGSVVGSHLAVRYGSELIRRVFVVVVAALIVKTAYDAFG
ncbi:MAG: sulfite exporter TauE/SafE family protein [Myxococcota bacterium]